MQATGSDYVILKKVHMRVVVCVEVFNFLLYYNKKIIHVKRCKISRLVTAIEQTLLGKQRPLFVESQCLGRLMTSLNGGQETPPARPDTLLREILRRVERTLLHLAEGQRLNNRERRQVGRRGCVV